MLLDEIIAPIANELILLEQHIDKLLHSDTKLVNEIVNHLKLKPGKRLRPSVMLLLGKLFGEVNEKLISYAAMVEILHNATIIHDDIVDAATERRGLASVNTKWNNKIAVLIGDYLFAKSFNAIRKYNDFNLLDSFAKTTIHMSEGELLAMQLGNSLDFSEEGYYKIIYAKTASLIETACTITASIYSDDAVTIDKIASYGRNIGMGFQIKDDLFDYTADSQAIGKPVGNDIKEKQITLPLIYALNNADNTRKEHILRLLRQPTIDDATVKQITNFAQAMHGVEYAQKQAEHYTNAAIECLADFPQSDIKNKLIQFAQYMISRKY